MKIILKKPSTSDDVEPFKQNVWDKIMSIVKSKEVGFIVLALILALLCVFFWEIAVSAGVLSQTTEFIGGALAALRLYAPGLAVTLFAGIKAFFSFRKT
uniref:Candidate secreted effector n=1 Tax=Meloidogyne incognita TaxID=6306 RepID=A0A914NJB9_MELIC